MSRSSVYNAEGKANQRARNGNATRSGSSGAATEVKNYPSLSWEEVENDVEHVVDIAARMSHTQVGSAGQMVATLNVPLAYAHALLDAHMASRSGMIYVRIYNVPIERFIGAVGERLEELAEGVLDAESE
jgi:hypothetical protein